VTVIRGVISWCWYIICWSTSVYIWYYYNWCDISGLGLTIFFRLRPHSIWPRPHSSLAFCKASTTSYCYSWFTELKNSMASAMGVRVAYLLNWIKNVITYSFFQLFAWHGANIVSFTSNTVSGDYMQNIQYIALTNNWTLCILTKHSIKIMASLHEKVTL